MQPTRLAQLLFLWVLINTSKNLWSFSGCAAWGILRISLLHFQNSHNFNATHGMPGREVGYSGEHLALGHAPYRRISRPLGRASRSARGAARGGLPRATRSSARRPVAPLASRTCCQDPSKGTSWRERPKLVDVAPLARRAAKTCGLPAKRSLHAATMPRGIALNPHLGVMGSQN